MTSHSTLKLYRGAFLKPGIRFGHNATKSWGLSCIGAPSHTNNPRSPLTQAWSDSPGAASACAISDHRRSAAGQRTVAHA